MRSPFVLGTILAHPDDETFGVGGTLVRYVGEGVAVHSLCLTQGEAGWAGDPDAPLVPRERLGETRAAELHEAGRRMGLASVTVLRWPDGALAEAPEDAVVADVVGWLRRVRPDVVIIWGPDGGYGHPDHIAAGERAVVALAVAASTARPELGAPHAVRRCYRYVASAEMMDGIGEIYPDFAEYMKTLAVKPQRWTRDRLGAAIDVRPYWDAKWAAMQAHRTQAPDLRAWETARQRGIAIFLDETFIRAFPDPDGPLETDLFAALRDPR